MHVNVMAGIQIIWLTFFTWLGNNCCCAQNQGSDEAPPNFYGYKPNLATDSIALIKARIRKVRIYQFISNDTLPLKYVIGEWIIHSDSTRIISSRWTKSNDPANFGLYYNPLGAKHREILSVKSNKNTVTEVIDLNGCKRKSNREVSLVHYLDNKGQVYETELKNRENILCETFYSFSKIRYYYLNGMLLYALYYNSEMVPGYELYTSLYFEYVK